MLEGLKHIYIVDCDSVGYQNINPIVRKNSMVLYFGTRDDGIAIFDKNAEFVEIVKTEYGLARIISLELGRCIAMYGRNVMYYIVSKDKVFNALVEYAQRGGYYVYRYSGFDSDIV